MQEKTQHFSKKFKDMTFRLNNVRFLLKNSLFSLDIFDPVEHIASQEIGDKDEDVYKRQFWICSWQVDFIDNWQDFQIIVQR